MSEQARRWELPQPYEEMDHTADTGIVVRGASAEEALARLVLAFAQLVSGGRRVTMGRTLEVHVEPGDRVSMAIDVLRELLYQLDVSGWVPRSCEVRRFDERSGAHVVVDVGRWEDANRVNGEDARGDGARHGGARDGGDDADPGHRYDFELDETLELKAVTWHAARFEREGDGWVAQVVFDV